MNSSNPKPGAYLWPKHQIFYSRAYRTLPKLPLFHLLALISFVVLLDMGLFIYRVEISYLVTDTASLIARQAGVDNALVQLDYFWAQMYTIEAIGSFPTPLFALINLIVSVILLLVVPRIRILPPPVTFWMFYACFIHAISSAFFVFFAQHFPYTVLDFTTLYMELEFVMWLLIPVVILLTAGFYPSGLANKIGLLSFTLLYSMVFGSIRLAVFVVSLEYGSMIYMAVMFFLLGSLVDFIYITGFYSVFAARSAKRLARKEATWRWLS